MGLDPGTPGSCPELKADAQLLSHSGAPIIHILFFKKILFIHERDRQREKQAACREPDVGLDPGTPGSLPELKADAQLLSHPSIPDNNI